MTKLSDTCTAFLREVRAAEEKIEKAALSFLAELEKEHPHNKDAKKLMTLAGEVSLKLNLVRFEGMKPSPLDELLLHAHGVINRESPRAKAKARERA